MEKPAKFSKKVSSVNPLQWRNALIYLSSNSCDKVKNLTNPPTPMQFVSRKVFESQDVPLARTYRLAASKDLLDLIWPCPGNIELD